MTDLEITKFCAEAMGYEEYPPKAWWTDEDRESFNIKKIGLPWVYDPLHDDEQAMALVKRFHLHIEDGPPDWEVFHPDSGTCFNKDLNRAICECVAKMQLKKGNP